MGLLVFKKALNDTTLGRGSIMQRFLVGVAIAVALIYWLSGTSAEQTAVNEIREPPARVVVQEQTPSTGANTQVSAGTPRHLRIDGSRRQMNGYPIPSYGLDVIGPLLNERDVQSCQLMSNSSALS